MPRPTKEQLHLFKRREEMIFTLDYEGYNGEEIGTMVGLSRSVVNRILKRKPKGWKPK